jgi:hypothetical protein
MILHQLNPFIRQPFVPKFDQLVFFIQVALLPVNSHSLVLEDFADPSIIEGHRMKRDAYEDEEPVEDFYDTNDDNMEIGKQSSGKFQAYYFFDVTLPPP